LLAKYLRVADLDMFADLLISWNGKQKYSRRRKRLERMIEDEHPDAFDK